MTGQEMYEQFNRNIGFAKANHFADLPPLYQNAWDQLAVQAHDDLYSPKRQINQQSEVQFGPPDSLHSYSSPTDYLRPLRIEVPQGQPMPRDYIDITNTQDSVRGVRVGVLGLGR